MTPSTNQSSRRPPHRKKFARTVNCFFRRHPGTGSTFTRDHVSSRTIRRHLAEGHLGSRRPLCAMPLTPPYGIVPTTRKLDCSGMEPGPL
ncbi:uncharacterized protein TNCV_4273401 [Trichonephila clavipes]|nr:uncharacterized protein TNCV_4273401 [Trichonephila clavipes]